MNIFHRKRTKTVQKLPPDFPAICDKFDCDCTVIDTDVVPLEMLVSDQTNAKHVPASECISEKCDSK